MGSAGTGAAQLAGCGGRSPADPCGSSTIIHLLLGKPLRLTRVVFGLAHSDYLTVLQTVGEEVSKPGFSTTGACPFSDPAGGTFSDRPAVDFDRAKQ
jgi:hypothetical protein